MQILLLLSALLSAISGVFGVARPLETRVDQAGAQITAPAAASARVKAESGQRVENCLPALAAIAHAPFVDADVPRDPPLTNVCLIE